MTVAGTSSVSTATTSQTAINSTLGKDEFLKLLITQIRHQDAMNPMDDKEFISQMAQFSSLEQMQNLNNTMETSFKSMAQSQENLNSVMLEVAYQLYQGNIDDSVRLLGREVTYKLDGVEKTGTISSLKQVDGRYVPVIDGENIPLDQIISIK